MNAVWGETRVALHLAAVVPFLPFTPAMIEAVVDLHVNDIGTKLAQQRGRWQRVVFDPAVIRRLSSPPFVEYRKVSLLAADGTPSGEVRTSSPHTRARLEEGVVVLDAAASVATTSADVDVKVDIDDFAVADS